VKPPQVALLAIAVTCMLLAFVPPAHGHPLGNFTVNRYSRIDLSPEGIRVLYIVDMAEIPTVQEKAMLDRNHDGEVTETERANYLNTRIGRLQRELRLTIDGNTVPLRALSSDLSFPPGEAGMETTRLAVTFLAEISPDGERPISIRYEDGSFEPRMGWGEIVLRAGEGVRILASTAPADDLTDELRDYPPDLTASVPEVRVAEASFLVLAAPGLDKVSDASDPQPGAQPSTGAVLLPSGEAWSLGGVALPFGKESVPPLPGGEGGPLGMVIALLLAGVWGAAHALSPGHGKAVVGAYLVGARGTARHAVYLGLTVTATHTLGVYALGLLTLFAAHFVRAETLYPWLSLIASLAVMLVGASLLLSRSRALLAGRSDDHHHDHHAAHSHDEAHYHEEAHYHGDGAHHHHGEGDGHHHDHGHGHHSHPHLPPGAQGEGVTWRSLLALGVAGGLVPCPSALVLMLGMIALGQVALGLLLVVSFSLGLALVLTAIGIAFVYAGRFLLARRFPGSGAAAPLLRVAPVGSALVILIIGLLMAVQAGSQTGSLALVLR
jgi:nickel/cobalt transporter (NicO) family protein